MTSSDAKNVPALEQLLSDLNERAQISYPALAPALREALMLCRTACTVHAASNIQLQGALASIRSGHPDDAAEFLECAIRNLARWIGAQ